MPEIRWTALSTIRELKEHNTEVYFEKENIWTFDSKGELLITIMSSSGSGRKPLYLRERYLGTSESEWQTARWRWPTGRFIGYDKGENGSMVINEEEAKVIRLIYGEFSGRAFLPRPLLTA